MESTVKGNYRFRFCGNEIGNPETAEEILLSFLIL